MMPQETKVADKYDVDKSLIAMFLRMSPEERLKANDDAFRTMMELRDAYRRRKTDEWGPK